MVAPIVGTRTVILAIEIGTKAGLAQHRLRHLGQSQIFWVTKADEDLFIRQNVAWAHDDVVGASRFERTPGAWSVVALHAKCRCHLKLVAVRKEEQAWGDPDADALGPVRFQNHAGTEPTD